MGNILMTSRYRLLEEVMVKSTVAAIRMKGDTLEYKADSFYVKPGANVEELLKRLPGIEVNRDGTIKAQGEKVTQVLVDGDEFFSDDPSLATKYLQANSVDKVQVFDKKSDQSTFTGIDDGKHSKTINIKLKENSKQGYFGKLSAGSNANDIYNNEAMFNRFRNKQKISVFGISSNTGVTGLSYQDRSQYLSTDNERIDDQSGSLLFNSNDYEGERYGGSGLPTSMYAGAQFSNKWKEDKQKLNGNYRLNRLATNGWQTNKSTQILPDSSIRETTSSTTNHSSQNQHKIAGAYDVAIDSFASVKIYMQGIKKENSGEMNNYSETKNGKDQSFLNKSTQNAIDNGNSNQFNGSILWRQRFRKTGRTLSLNVQHSYNDFSGLLQTEAVNFLYDTVTHIPATETPDQQQQNKITTYAYAAKLAYTEALSKLINVEISYAVKLTNTEKNRMVFVKGINGKYETFVDSLSSNYYYKVISHIPGLLIHFTKKKLNITTGGQLGFTSLEQSGISSTFSNRHFINFSPQTSLQFNLKQLRSLSISYNGRTDQPTIDQLQPLKDNSNSLSQFIGNPDLKPSFTHSFSLNFFDYKMATNRNLYGYAGYSFTQNAITSSTEYGQYNKTQYQFINIDGSSNMYGNFGYSRNFNKIHLTAGANVSFNHSVYITVINKIKNTNENNNINIGPNINYNKPDKFSIGIVSYVNFNNSKASTGNLSATNTWSHNHNITASVFLPWKLELTTDVNMNFQPYNAAFNNSMQVIRWNAALIKKLTKDGKTEAKLAVFDILNQSTGYNRYAGGNYISEGTSNYIPRYALLSFTWNFTHMHK
jgi:hypothetical protein